MFPAVIFFFKKEKMFPAGLLNEVAVSGCFPFSSILVVGRALSRARAVKNLRKLRRDSKDFNLVHGVVALRQ